METGDKYQFCDESPRVYNNVHLSGHVGHRKVALCQPVRLTTSETKSQEKVRFRGIFPECSCLLGQLRDQNAREMYMEVMFGLTHAFPQRNPLIEYFKWQNLQNREDHVHDKKCQLDTWSARSEFNANVQNGVKGTVESQTHPLHPQSAQTA